MTFFDISFLYSLFGDYMKKLVAFILFIIVILFFISEDISNKKELEERSIFISYIELSKYISDDISLSKKNIDTMINNIEELGFNSVILQVRSFGDSIYPSKIFSNSLYVSSSFDILDYFSNICKSRGFKLYAWINPYRIRNSLDRESIDSDNIIYKLLDTRHIVYTSGIYFNPSSELVINLIVEGVEEIIDNYDVTGILFDDYFYPSIDCDLEEYNVLDLDISYDEYKLGRVNELIRRVYDACHDREVLFGVSPDGNIDNNYSKHSADVKTWLSNSGYVDFIMPQIYYGFFNGSRPFYNTLKEWSSLIKNDSISMSVALAFYKNGLVDEWASSGKNEWIENNNIIMKEIIISRNINNYMGISLFRYDYLFSKDKINQNTIGEIENIKKIIK